MTYETNRASICRLKNKDRPVKLPFGLIREDQYGVAYLFLTNVGLLTGYAGYVYETIYGISY